ncbi:MAG: Mur ligase family protein, partial [Elusimicrobiales bacterium]|nr:Mur ligase family protein [Elusimicrobiales bacterium]
HYLPHVAVVTNMEFDHADIYRDDVAYRYAFSRFINLVPGSGTLVVGWDDPVCRELATRSFAPVESFGVGVDSGAGSGADAGTGPAAETGPPATGEVRAAGAAETRGPADGERRRAEARTAGPASPVPGP